MYIYIHNIYYTFASGASEGTQMNVASSGNQSQTSSSVEGIHAYILNMSFSNKMLESIIVY